MKLRSVFKHLPRYVLAAGGVGLLLRIWLLARTDEKGFLVSNPVATVLLWLPLPCLWHCFFSPGS